MVGARFAFFSAELQQIGELNQTATQLWRWLEEGYTARAMVAALTAHGANAPDAEGAVEAAIGQWLRSGLITPTAAIDALKAPPRALLRIAIDGFRADIAFHGADTNEIAAVFRHLAEESASQAALKLSVYRRDGIGDFILEDAVPVGLFAPAETAPKLKAILTEAYCESIVDGFLAHGALVRLSGKTVFLGGEPGAGKTTLTIALCLAGAGFCGDDIVHVHGDGLVTGAPFAAAIKTGAWPLLAERLPDLRMLAAHERADGHRTRYFAPQLADNTPRALDSIVFLSRDGGGASIAPMDPLDALCRFIDSSYASDGSLDPNTFSALARRFADIPCFALNTGDLDDSVRLLQDTSRVA